MTAVWSNRAMVALAAIAVLVTAPYWLEAVLNTLLLGLGALIWIVVISFEVFGG